MSRMPFLISSWPKMVGAIDCASFSYTWLARLRRV
jgi:hypothetical protein